jgi:hypothetical protein
MKKTITKLASIVWILILAAVFAAPAYGAGTVKPGAALDKAAAYMLNAVKNPDVGSVGGEWAVIGLARSGYVVPEAYYERYYEVVEQYVRERQGVLHEKKYTEYSRVILGLTAAGYDPRKIAGYDLTLALGDFEQTIWQGINGPIWALIALDSRDYPIPRNPDAKTQATRDLYIGEILRRQISDGGWNLTAGADGPIDSREKGDPDLTGMALQALAKYQDKPEVKAATGRARTFLSNLQDDKGGYTGWGDVNSESSVQVLAALGELGIPLDDPRFVKNSNTILDNILSFQNPDGSFKHTVAGGGNSQMSSEQCFYGLVAAARLAEGRNSLYRMGDAAKRGAGLPDLSAPAAAGQTAGLPGTHPDVKRIPVTQPGKTFDDIQGHVGQAAIEALASKGILGGKSEQRFDPDATMTRAEFAAAAIRALGLPGKPAASGPESTPVPAFADVPAAAWFAQAVNTAYAYQLVSGVSANAFNPSGEITRQEAAVMVARAAKLCGMDISVETVTMRDTLAQFGDYRTAAEWARAALAFCYRAGVMDESALDIRPLVPATRAEIVEMLYRMLDAARLT